MVPVMAVTGDRQTITEATVATGGAGTGGDLWDQVGIYINLSSKLSFDRPHLLHEMSV